MEDLRDRNNNGLWYSVAFGQNDVIDGQIPLPMWESQTQRIEIANEKLPLTNISTENHHRHNRKVPKLLHKILGLNVALKSTMQREVRMSNNPLKQNNHIVTPSGWNKAEREEIKSFDYTVRDKNENRVLVKDEYNRFRNLIDDVGYYEDTNGIQVNIGRNNNAVSSKPKSYTILDHYSVDILHQIPNFSQFNFGLMTLPNVPKNSFRSNDKTRNATNGANMRKSNVLFYRTLSNSRKSNVFEKNAAAITPEQTSTTSTTYKTHDAIRKTNYWLRSRYNSWPNIFTMKYSDNHTQNFKHDFTNSQMIYRRSMFLADKPVTISHFKRVLDKSNEVTRAFRNWTGNSNSRRANTNGNCEVNNKMEKGGELRKHFEFSKFFPSAFEIDNLNRLECPQDVPAVKLWKNVFDEMNNFKTLMPQKTNCCKTGLLGFGMKKLHSILPIYKNKLVDVKNYRNLQGKEENQNFGKLNHQRYHTRKLMSLPSNLMLQKKQFLDEQINSNSEKLPTRYLQNSYKDTEVHHYYRKNHVPDRRHLRIRRAPKACRKEGICRRFNQKYIDEIDTNTRNFDFLELFRNSTYNSLLYAPYLYIDSGIERPPPPLDVTGNSFKSGHTGNKFERASMLSYTKKMPNAGVFWVTKQQGNVRRRRQDSKDANQRVKSIQKWKYTKSDSVTMINTMESKASSKNIKTYPRHAFNDQGRLGLVTSSPIKRKCSEDNDDCIPEIDNYEDNATKRQAEKKIKIELPTYYPNMTLKLIQSFEITFLNTSIGSPMQLVGTETKWVSVTNDPMNTTPTTRISTTMRNEPTTSTVANFTDSTTTNKVQVVYVILNESQPDKLHKLYEKIANKIHLYHQNTTLISHVMQGVKESTSPFSMSHLQHVAQKGGNITHDISLAGIHKVHEAYVLLAQVIHNRHHNASKRCMNEIAVGSVPMSTKTKDPTSTSPTFSSTTLPSVTLTTSALANSTEVVDGGGDDDDDDVYVDDQIEEVSNYEIKSTTTGWTLGADYEREKLHASAFYETGGNPHIKIEGLLPSAIRVKVVEIGEPGGLESIKLRSKRQEPLENDPLFRSIRILNIRKNSDGTFSILSPPKEGKKGKNHKTAKPSKPKLQIIVGEQSKLPIKHSEVYTKKTIDSYIGGKFLSLINGTSQLLNRTDIDKFNIGEKFLSLINGTSQFLNRPDIDKLKVLMSESNFTPKKSEPVTKNLRGHERTLYVTHTSTPYPDAPYLNQLKLCSDHIDKINNKTVFEDEDEETKSPDIDHRIEACKHLLNQLKVLFNVDRIEHTDDEMNTPEKKHGDLELIKLFIRNHIGLLKKYADKNAIELNKLVVAVDSIKKLAETQDAIKNLASVCAHDEREDRKNSFLFLKVKVCNFALKFLNKNLNNDTDKSVNADFKLIQYYLNLIRNSNVNDDYNNGDGQNYTDSQVRNSKVLQLMLSKLRRVVTKLNTNVNEKVDLTTLPMAAPFKNSIYTPQYILFGSSNIPNISDVLLNKSENSVENSIANEITSAIPSSVTFNEGIPNITDVVLNKPEMETTNGGVIPVTEEMTSTIPFSINFSDDRKKRRPNSFNIRKLVKELEYKLGHLNKPKNINFNNNVYGNNTKNMYHIIASVRQVRASEPKNVGSFTNNDIYHRYYTDPSILDLSKSYYEKKYRNEDNVMKYEEGGDIIYNNMLEYLIKGSGLSKDDGTNLNTGTDKNVEINEIVSEGNIDGYTDLSDAFNDDLMFEKNNFVDEEMIKKKNYLDHMELKRLRRKKHRSPNKAMKLYTKNYYQLVNRTTTTRSNAARISKASILGKIVKTVSTLLKIQSECDPLADQKCICDMTKTTDNLLGLCQGPEPPSKWLYQLMEFPCSYYKFMPRSLSIDDTANLGTRDRSLKAVNVKSVEARMGILSHNTDDKNEEVSVAEYDEDVGRKRRKRHVMVDVTNFEHALKRLPKFGIAKKDIYVIAGSSLRLRCDASEPNASAAMNWFKNGRVVEVSENVELVGDTLGLRNVSLEGGGNYTCGYMEEDASAAVNEGDLQWYHVSVVTLPHYELLMGMMYRVARPLVKQDLELLSVGGKLLGEQLCAGGRLCNFTLLDVEGHAQKKQHSASGRMRYMAMVSVRDVATLCGNAFCDAHCRAASHASVAYMIAAVLPRIARTSFRIRRTDRVASYHPLETAGTLHWLTIYNIHGKDKPRKKRLRGHLDPFDLRLLISCDKGMRLDVPHKICVAHEGKLKQDRNKIAERKKSSRRRTYTLAATVLAAAVLAGIGTLFVLSLLHVTPFAKLKKNG